MKRVLWCLVCLAMVGIGRAQIGYDFPMRGIDMESNGDGNKTRWDETQIELDTNLDGVSEVIQESDFAWLDSVVGADIGPTGTPIFSSLILSNNGETVTFTWNGDTSELEINAGPDTLRFKLDDHGDFVAEGSITGGVVIGSNSLRASGQFSLEADGAVNVAAAGTTIDLNALAVTALTPSSNLTMTATPTIALETDGTFAYVYNVSPTFTLTLQDKAVLASSALNLWANTVTLSEGEGILLLMEGTEWLQIGGTSNQHNGILVQSVGHPSDPDAIEVSPDDLTFNADTTTTGIATVDGDLRVNGGGIGPSVDPNLMQLATDSLTINGTTTVSGTASEPLLIEQSDSPSIGGYQFGGTAAKNRITRNLTGQTVFGTPAGTSWAVMWNNLLSLQDNAEFGWSSTSAASGAIDTKLERDSAGVVKITDHVKVEGVYLSEQTTNPSLSDLTANTECRFHMKGDHVYIVFNDGVNLRYLDLGDLSTASTTAP